MRAKRVLGSLKVGFVAVCAVAALTLAASPADAIQVWVQFDGKYQFVDSLQFNEAELRVRWALAKEAAQTEESDDAQRSALTLKRAVSWKQWRPPGGISPNQAQASPAPKTMPGLSPASVSPSTTSKRKSPDQPTAILRMNGVWTPRLVLTDFTKQQLESSLSEARAQPRSDFRDRSIAVVEEAIKNGDFKHGDEPTTTASSLSSSTGTGSQSNSTAANTQSNSPIAPEPAKRARIDHAQPMDTQPTVVQPFAAPQHTRPVVESATSVAKRIILRLKGSRLGEASTAPPTISTAPTSVFTSPAPVSPAAVSAAPTSVFTPPAPVSPAAVSAAPTFGFPALAGSPRFAGLLPFHPFVPLRALRSQPTPSLGQIASARAAAAVAVTPAPQLPAASFPAASPILTVASQSVPWLGRTQAEAPTPITSAYETEVAEARALIAVQRQTNKRLYPDDLKQKIVAMHDKYVGRSLPQLTNVRFCSDLGLHRTAVNKWRAEIRLANQDAQPTTPIAQLTSMPTPSEFASPAIDLAANNEDQAATSPFPHQHTPVPDTAESLATSSSPSPSAPPPALVVATAPAQPRPARLVIRLDLSDQPSSDSEDESYRENTAAVVARSVAEAQVAAPVESSASESTFSSELAALKQRTEKLCLEGTGSFEEDIKELKQQITDFRALHRKHNRKLNSFPPSIRTAVGRVFNTYRNSQCLSKRGFAKRVTISFDQLHSWAGSSIALQPSTSVEVVNPASTTETSAPSIPEALPNSPREPSNLQSDTDRDAESDTEREQETSRPVAQLRPANPCYSASRIESDDEAMSPGLTLDDSEENSGSE